MLGLGRHNTLHTVQTATGKTVTDKQLSVVKSGESATFVAYIDMVETMPGGVQVFDALLIVTEQRVLVCKSKAFGGSKVVLEVPLAKIESVDDDIYPDNKIHIFVPWQSHGSPLELVVGLENSPVEIASAIRMGYQRVQKGL